MDGSADEVKEGLGKSFADLVHPLTHPPTYFFMLVTLIFVMKYIESSRLCLSLVAFFSLKILMRIEKVHYLQTKNASQKILNVHQASQQW